MLNLKVMESGLSMNDKKRRDTRSSKQIGVDGYYSKYVLFVMVLVCILNYVDRQILAILAEEIKADLNLSDANLGFLAGTAFAVFYATFGIVLGRLADVWNRKKLIAIGLGVWSLMTSLSGFASGFFSLAVCRFGVGAGEASATPASYSMLYDYFSPKVRTTVLAIFNAGITIGSGLGILIGGLVLSSWDSAWPSSNLAPLGLKGWQAAFMVVGLPGLLMVLWVSTLREPERGQVDNTQTSPHPHPFHETLTVLLSMVPIVNWNLLAKSSSASRAISLNIIASLTIILVTWLLIRVTGNSLQWVALAIGVYAVLSWLQLLATRDRVVFGMIFNCRTVYYTILGMAVVAFFKVAATFWFIPFFQRYHGVSAAEVAKVLGLGSIVMGVIGAVLGGVLADKLRTRTGKGKLYVFLGSLCASTLSSLIVLTASNVVVAYIAAVFFSLTFYMATGPAASTINDLVLPRGRATTSAFYHMSLTFFGIALGPYFIGYISDTLISMGVSSSESLRQGLLWSLLAPIIGMIFIAMAIRYIEADEASVIERARALGENI